MVGKFILCMLGVNYVPLPFAILWR